MDRTMDFNGMNGFPPPYMNTEINADFQTIDGGMFNPINQYEQAYMYYRYMAQMMDYKIKCKEYEKICERQETSSRNLDK